MAGPAMAVPVLTLQNKTLCGHAQKCEHSSETSVVCSPVPPGPAILIHLELAMQRHEGATRAHPDN